MSSRFQRIARAVAERPSHISAYPRLAGLAVLRGDLDAGQAELVEEAAYSMGSSARRLEASLEELARLAAALDRLGEADEPRRPELVTRFNAQRDQALQRLHYLRIQREAL